jgi:hypothetical protein
MGEVYLAQDTRLAPYHLFRLRARALSGLRYRWVNGDFTFYE